MHSDGRLLRRNRRHLQELYPPQGQVTSNYLPTQGTSRDDTTPPSQQRTDPLEEVSAPPTGNRHIQSDNPGQTLELNQQPDVLTPDRPIRTKRAPQKYKDFVMYN